MLLGLAGSLSIDLITWTHGSTLQGPVEPAAWVGALATSLGLAREGAYTKAALLSGITQARLLIKPLLLGVACLIACLFVLYHGKLPFRSWPLVWAGSCTVLIAAFRFPLAHVIRRWSIGGRLARKIAIVGVNDFSQEFIKRLRDDPNAYHILGIYDDRRFRVPSINSGINVQGTIADLLLRSQVEKVDVIVIALPLAAIERIKAIMDQLSSTIADIVLTTDLAGLQFSRAQFIGIGLNPVVVVREAPLKDWQALKKTVLDKGIGALALLIFAPVMLLTAVLIKLDSIGPVLFRQPRMGFNNQTFLCYKFRSMRHDMTDLLADKQTTRDDPRVTRVGRIIRKLSIDELPQILNVLNGTMSLVGPRPHAVNTKAADRLFSEVVKQYAMRHRVRPGITGWAQVNGWRGETTTVEQIEQRVACDLFYIENWSLRFDLKIMMKTVLHVIHSRSAF